MDRSCAARRSPSRVPPAKLAACRATGYRVGVAPDPFVLRPGRRSRQLAGLMRGRGAGHAAVMTAFNPRGRLRDARANVRASRALRAILVPRARAVLPCDGSDPAGLWPVEPGDLALGPSPRAAAAIARRFAQDAFLPAGASAVARLVALR